MRAWEAEAVERDPDGPEDLEKLTTWEEGEAESVQRNVLGLVYSKASETGHWAASPGSGSGDDEVRRCG